ncbi:Partner of SLD five PSF1 [Trichostrongylus colubriformis]|uniref:DNA replication complex GINS protein PSF1 n=1 Tax=Trichostrongylus colubriformis TaxID=6319 RepID=A0AAN8FIJ8_TRICO
MYIYRMPSDNENLEGVADQALLLLTQMKRNPDVMPPYNEEAMRACIAKMNELYNLNNECVTRLRSQGERASRELEALMICRNEALQHIRVGDLNTHPPKALYVQVRVLENYGEFETSDGNLVMLQVNSTVS